MIDSSRAETTLFLLASLDGKITTGEPDTLDSDRDWRRIAGVKEGLHQYYDIERTLAVHSLNSGRVMEKISVNARTDVPEKDPRLTFYIIDRKPHLTERGVRYLSSWVGRLFLVTNNPRHPALSLAQDLHNVKVIFYDGAIDLYDLLVKARHYGTENLAIETGGPSPPNS